MYYNRSIKQFIDEISRIIVSHIFRDTAYKLFVKAIKEKEELLAAYKSR